MVTDRRTGAPNGDYGAHLRVVQSLVIDLFDALGPSLQFHPKL